MDIKVEAVEVGEEQLEPLLYDDGSRGEVEINYKEYHQSDREFKTLLRVVDEGGGIISTRELTKGTHVRVSPEQRIIMLQFMEEHPELARNKLSSTHGTLAQRQHLWAEFARRLNTSLTGASKPVEKWVKSWQDWKCDVKGKRLGLKRHAGGPGVTTLPPLTEVEERLLRVTGQLTSKGVEGVKDPLESQLNFSAQASSSSSPNLVNPQEVIEISYASPEDCSETPSPPSPIPSPVPPTTFCSVSTSPIPFTTQTSSSSDHLPSQPSTCKESCERRRKKRKRGENDDDKNPSIEERLVIAAERRAAATQQMADTFDEVTKRVADAFIAFLQRH